MEYTGSLGRIFNLLLPKCRTKFLYKAGKPYNISILANAEIHLFHRTDVLINAGSPYIYWSLEECINNCFTISLRGFLQKIHLYFYISCTISIHKFVFYNNQIVHEIYKNSSIIKILFVCKFHHKTSYG